ncbi:hypothetical protein Tco_0706201, partial [Tanacetum coccineum]
RVKYFLPPTIEFSGSVTTGGGVTFGVLSGSIGELACGAKGVLGGDSRGVDGGATL